MQRALLGFQRGLGIERQRTYLTQEMQQIRQLADGYFVERATELDHNDEIKSMVNGGRFRGSGGSREHLRDFGSGVLLPPAHDGYSQRLPFAVGEVGIRIEPAHLPFLF